MQIKLKKITAALISSIFLFYASFPAQAFIFGGSIDSVVSSNEIFVLDDINAIYSLTLIDAESENPWSVLPQTVDGYTKNDMVSCSIVWNVENIELRTGYIEINGDVYCPDGYTLSNSCLDISMYVGVYNSESNIYIPLPDESYYQFLLPTVTVPIGSSASDVLSGKCSNYEGSDSYGNYINIPIKWDLSAVNYDVNGVYKTYGTYCLPKGMAFEKEPEIIEADVYICQPDEVDLGGYYFLSYSLYCTWAYPIDHENAHLEMKIGDSGWEKENEFSFISSRSFSMYLEYLDINQRYSFRVAYEDKYSDVLSFTYTGDGHVYNPTYEGSRDGGDQNEPPLPDVTQPAITTEEITEAVGMIPIPVIPPAVTTTPTVTTELIAETPAVTNTTASTSAVISEFEEIIDIDTEYEEIDEATVSASDTYTEASPETQPIITATSSVLTTRPVPEDEYNEIFSLGSSAGASEQNNVVTEAEISNETAHTTENSQNIEKISQDSVTISGTRLILMLEDSAEYVPFEKNGVVLRIPTDYLRNLNISDDDKISVEISKNNALSFAISIILNDNNLTEIPDSMVQLQADNGDYALYINGAKTEQTVTVLNNIAEFYISKTGVYTLESNTPSENSILPAVIIAAVTIIAVGSAIVVIKRGKKSDR